MQVRLFVMKDDLDINQCEIVEAKEGKKRNDYLINLGDDYGLGAGVSVGAGV